MSTSFISIFNLMLRGSTLLLKFLLTFFLAKYLSVGELGQFGLVLAINALAGYVIGLDFYQFSTREILAATPGNRPLMIRNQFVLHLLTSAIALPVIFLLVSAYYLPPSIALLAIAVVLLEQLNQETFRLLATLSRPVSANLVYFIRQGSWIPVACWLFWQDSANRSLEPVLQLWILGATVSLLLSCYYLADLPWRNTLRHAVDLRWIKRGISVSLVLLASTLLINASIYLSRFFLSHYHYEDEVGIITFYWNIANVIQTLTYTGIIMVLYPKLISAYQAGDTDLYKNLYRKMTMGCVISLLLMVIAALVLIDPVLGWIDKPDYRDNAGVLPWLLVAAVCYTLAQVANYALYVRHLDYHNLLTALVAFVVCFVCHWFFIPDFGLQGAIWSTVAGAAAFFIIKMVFVLSINPHS